MSFINMSNFVGILIGKATEDITGSLFITLLLLVLVLIAFAMLFQIPLEWTTIFILPLLLGYMAYYKEYVIIGSVAFIYLALVFTQKFIFK